MIGEYLSPLFETEVTKWIQDQSLYFKAVHLAAVYLAGEEKVQSLVRVVRLSNILELSGLGGLGSRFDVNNVESLNTVCRIAALAGNQQSKATQAVIASSLDATLDHHMELVRETYLAETTSD